MALVHREASRGGGYGAGAENVEKETVVGAETVTPFHPSGVGLGFEVYLATAFVVMSRGWDCIK